MYVFFPPSSPLQHCCDGRRRFICLFPAVLNTYRCCSQNKTFSELSRKESRFSEATTIFFFGRAGAREESLWKQSCPQWGNKSGVGVTLMQVLPLPWILGKGLISSPNYCMWWARCIQGVSPGGTAPGKAADTPGTHQSPARASQAESMGNPRWGTIRELKPVCAWQKCFYLRVFARPQFFASLIHLLVVWPSSLCRKLPLGFFLELGNKFQLRSIPGAVLGVFWCRGCCQKLLGATLQMVLLPLPAKFQCTISTGGNW